jgi:hypothetical protein
MAEHSLPRKDDSPSLSAAAQRIMRDLVVERGLSYAEAIRRAEAKAIEAAGPYHEVADHLWHWLEDHQ